MFIKRQSREKNWKIQQEVIPGLESKNVKNVIINVKMSWHNNDNCSMVSTKKYIYAEEIEMWKNFVC